MSASYSIFIVLALAQIVTGKPATDSFRSTTIQVKENGKVEKYQTQESRSYLFSYRNQTLLISNLVEACEFR